LRADHTGFLIASRMKKRAWSIREAAASDVEAINQLFVDTMGMHRSLEHDRWKFWQNPFGRPYILVAEDEGKLVGHYALWPTPLRLGRESVQGAQSLDTMTHPAYQGQGMFPALASACYETASAHGCEAMYGFPNTNSYAGFVRRLNWDHVCDVKAYTRLLHPWGSPRFSGFQAVAAEVAARILPRGSDRGFEFRLGIPESDALDALLSASQADATSCRVNKTREWYRWRFSEASGKRYEWVGAYKGANLVGLAIWGMDILVPYPRALFSELLWAGPGAAEALVHAVVTRCRDAGMHILSAVTNVDAAIKAMRRSGFLRHTKVPFIVRGLTTRNLGGNIHDENSWLIFGADLDTF
jgi:GNAT superfamily N-acetyltransferase